MAGLCQLIATVPTGLEGGAADEVQETLGRKAEATRGRINFGIASFEQLKLVANIYDNASWLCERLTTCTFPSIP
jgi:23S rRNA G2445 N2-methylase RlmL